MTVFLPILVCLCGGVGASCRYLITPEILRKLVEGLR